MVKFTPIEKSILLDIVSHPNTSIKDVVDRLSVPQGKVSSLIPALESEGFVSRKEEVKTAYSLTKRGEKALKGLPERLLLKKVQENEGIHMSEINQKAGLPADDVKAAIGILRKGGVIAIDKGTLTIADEEKAERFSLDLQKGLELISNGKVIDEKLADQLIKRGFAEKIENVIVMIEPLIDKAAAEKIATAEEITAVTPHMLMNGTWRNYQLKPYNVKVKPKRIYPGKYHPYRHFHDHVRNKLIGLGFKEMKGPLVEQEFWNFDALYSPQDHPAREDNDIFLINHPTHGRLADAEYVENVKNTHQDGWKTGSRGYHYRWDPKKAARLLLRPQGTAISARTLVGLTPPAKYFSIAKCFRPDSIDATHGVEFYQAEGIICDPNITFRDLLGVLRTFAEDVAGATDVSFRPDYYPFTSPSVELSARHPTLGRIEFGGAGIFRPEVVKPFGIEYPVIAWGLGVDRLFMVKNKISDIRELFSQNLQWLRDVEVSSGIGVED